MSLLLPGTVIAAGAVILVYRRICMTPDDHDNSSSTVEQAYILTNKVTHARLLPAESAHRFAYQTLSLFIPLNALEKSELDLGHGWLFKYGSTSLTISGLRAGAYLGRSANSGPESITDKLRAVLNARGFDASQLHDAWMQTMPSYFGYEGINPLTVYYCYTVSNKLWLVVLEIHNTFGEQHIHILEPGKHEDHMCTKGFDHQWTFRRQFHVSPFNDRSGFYRVSVTLPSHSPSCTSKTATSPCPSIRVHLHTEDPNKPGGIGPLKLTASLHPVRSTPFTVTNWIQALAKQPFVLFLSLPRILYQAWILHYRKWLAVYSRPDPQPSISSQILPQNVDEAISDANTTSIVRNGQGIGWLPETVLERFARTRVEHLLQSHANQARIIITLIPEDPSVPRATFTPVTRGGSGGKPETNLTMWYQSPRFFTSWLISPSIEHLLLLKDDIEGSFRVSSVELFKVIRNPGDRDGPERATSFAQRLRTLDIPATLQLSTPPTGMIDKLYTWDIALILALLAFLAQERLEKWIFTSLRAGFVPGQEPWRRWERILTGHARLSRQTMSTERDGESPNVAIEFSQKGLYTTRNTLGSLRRDQTMP